MLTKYLSVFFISMVPLIELRGAIPVGVAMGLPLWQVYVIAIIGNMLPVPFIFFFARKVLEWGADKPVIGKFFTFCLEKGHKGGAKLKATAGRGLPWALLLFVGIPLPGTGAWTGTLAASLLDMDFKSSVRACMGGVLLAGCIMGALSVLGVSASALSRHDAPKLSSRAGCGTAGRAAARAVLPLLHRGRAPGLCRADGADWPRHGRLG